MAWVKILSGTDKKGKRENIRSFTFESGHIYTIVGKTGSGKSQLIEDIEAQTDGGGITKRKVVVSEDFAEFDIAELSQNMQFIMDLTVSEFIEIRSAMLCTENMDTDLFLDCVNSLCGEIVKPEDKLTRLSGGQSRAMMITDMALNEKSKMVLIDEIENAGIDKIKAAELLIKNDKIVVIITHDPLLSLYGEKRIIMKDGGMSAVIGRSDYETDLINELNKQHRMNENLRLILRNGYNITVESYAG